MAENLIDSITALNNAHVAGNVIFYYLVETLVEKGLLQLLFDMNARNDVPGYDYQFKKVATSLIESWMATDIY